MLGPVDVCRPGGGRGRGGRGFDGGRFDDGGRYQDGSGRGGPRGGIPMKRQAPGGYGGPRGSDHDGYGGPGPRQRQRTA